MEPNELRITLIAPKQEDAITISGHTENGVTAIFINNKGQEVALVMEEVCYIDSLIKHLTIAKHKMALQKKQEPHKYWRTEPRELKSNKPE